MDGHMLPDHRSRADPDPRGNRSVETDDLRVTADHRELMNDHTLVQNGVPLDDGMGMYDATRAELRTILDNRCRVNMHPACL